MSNMSFKTKGGDREDSSREGQMDGGTQVP